jgi:glutaredoxin-related protein
MRYSPVGPNPYKQPDKIVGILSIHSPNNISRAAIQIASLVPRTLVAVTTMIDLTTCNLTTIHCVYRLLSLVLTAKPDAGLDVLEITAHGPPVTRRRGMDILATYFATTVGHNVIARRPALTTYAAHRAKWETGQDRSLLEEDTEGHYYVPWRPNPDLDKCVSCLQPCRGFAVKCTLCGDLKHFYCLKQYDEVTEYSVTELVTASKPHRVGNISARYSLVPPRSDELVLGGGPSRGTTNATERQVGQHHLRLVNLFTLTLCDECKQPLWGTMAQAYVCQNQCQRFFHPVCVDNKHRLCYDPDELHDMSYDEISCLYANLWIQHEIYLNGISVGTLRLVDVPLEDDITGVALLLSQYEVLLSQHHLSPSPALIDFANVSAEDIPAKGCLLWQPRYLQYCAALLRAPSGSPPTDAPSPGGFLAVASSSFNEAEEQSVAYEQVPISIVQQALASDLHLRDDLAASTLIEQLRQFGLITIPNLRVVDKEVLGHNANVNVVTPLPLLMDSSPDVELLVLAIEGLLEDIDLTANEQGLSLLVKQAWPSIMCSPYAMIRLGGAVMSWIMDEVSDS